MSKEAPQRSCPEGHPLEESWEQCPFCAAEESDAGPATEVVRRASDSTDRLRDSGEGAVVVPRKAPPSRCLAGWLVVTQGDNPDHDYRLHAGPNVLGKGAECDVVIKDALVSSRHALIDCREGAYAIEDLQSKHGTRVDGEAVEGSRPLNDGQIIDLGSTQLRFRSYSH